MYRTLFTACLLWLTASSISFADTFYFTTDTTLSSLDAPYTDSGTTYTDVEVSSDAQLDVSGDVTVSDDGVLNVTGTDTNISTTNIYVGTNGDGRMRILDGAQVDLTGLWSGDVYIGGDSSSTSSVGVMVVSGEGSALTNVGSMEIGNGGINDYGRLKVLDGGYVIGAALTIASYPDPSSVKVDGAGSVIDFEIVQCTNWSFIRATNGGKFIGWITDVLGGGNVEITGEGSTYDSIVAFYVGERSGLTPGNLTIADGGVLNAAKCSFVTVTSSCWDENSTVTMDLSALMTADDYVAVDVSGLLNFGGDLLLSVFDTYRPEDDSITFDLFDWGSISDTTFDNIFWDEWAALGYVLDSSNLYVDGTVTFNMASAEPVPEPSCMLLVLIGIAGAFCSTRIRMKKD